MLQNILRDGAGTGQTNTKHLCFSCEQIFPSRACLEEHICSCASFICSCGTEFTEYKDMQEHSSTHEPGHQVLDHETIKKRRIERLREEQEKLKKLQKVGAAQKALNVGYVSPGSLPVKPAQQIPNTSALKSQVSVPAVQTPQVPQLNPTLPQAPALSNPHHLVNNMQKIFAGVGAPTVDLWTIYQPVVVMQTDDEFKKKKPYTCGKCGMGFMSKATLVSHHNLHAIDKISGCIGCGLLLCSKKVVPRYHVCNSPNNQTKFKLITAKPLNYKPPSEATRPNPMAQPPQGSSSLQLENQHPSAANKGRQVLHTASTQMLKNQNIRTYNSNNRGPRVTVPLQMKTQNPSASKNSTGFSLPSKFQSPNVPNQSSLQLPSPPSQWQKMSKSGTSSPHEFRCRVCHLLFETPQLLQRHKCIKAGEFMARHLAGKRNCKFNKMTPAITPNAAPMKGQTNLGFSPAGTKTNQFVPLSLDKGKVGVSVNGEIGVDDDDDCYIVESGSDKPAEMIYQVTSSVPIKT